MKKVVLLDFHNTLATCDGWLELEISTLPGLVLEKLASEGVVSEYSPELTHRATTLFKTLRQKVRVSGVEISAAEGAKRVLAQMGFSLPDKAVESVVAELEHALLPEVEAIVGVGEALARLRSAGYRLGVVSSAGYPPFVEMSLEKLGLRAYFSEVVTSAGEGIYKSDPKIFKRAVERLDATPQETVHVGDHAVYDVQTARAAGLSAIWFAEQAQHTARLHGVSWEETARQGADANAVIERMEELPGAVDSL